VKKQHETAPSCVSGELAEIPMITFRASSVLRIGTKSSPTIAEQGTEHYSNIPFWLSQLCLVRSRD